MNRILSVLTVAASVLCAGCGTQQAPTGAPIGRAELAVRALDARITGTAQQRVDGLFLDYAQEQSSLVACFKEHGAHYQPPPFAQTEKPETPGDLTAPDPIAMSVYLNEVSARIDQQIFEQRAREQAEQLTSSDVGSEAFAEAAAACTPQSASLSRYSTAAHDAWIALLVKVASSTGTSMADTEYVACMKARGVTAQGADDAFGPYPELANPDASPESARSNALARAKADIGCRQGDHLAFVEGVDAQLANFSSAHAAEIGEAEDMWAKISRDATQVRASWYAAHPELPQF